MAQRAFISPYHFHRIFKLYTKEPLNTFVNRLRMEHAAFLLIKSREVSISEISLQVGFANNSSFAKSFKKHFNQSPTKFRKNLKNEISKIRPIKSNIGQELSLLEDYICDMEKQKQWLIEKSKIKVDFFRRKTSRYNSSYWKC